MDFYSLSVWHHNYLWHFYLPLSYNCSDARVLSRDSPENPRPDVRQHLYWTTSPIKVNLWIIMIRFDLIKSNIIQNILNQKRQLREATKFFLLLFLFLIALPWFEEDILCIEEQTFFPIAKVPTAFKLEGRGVGTGQLNGGVPLWNSAFLYYAENLKPFLFLTADQLSRSLLSFIWTRRLQYVVLL